jgi:outer membrane protein assembly factor BamB
MAMPQFHARILAAFGAAIVSAVLLAPAYTDAQELAWEHDIKARTMHGWWVSGSGVPVVITGPFLSEKDRIEALDPSTGKSLWQRSLVKDGIRRTWEPVPFADRAIQQGNATLIDVKTGKDLWTAGAAGVNRVYDYLQVPELGLYVVHGPSRKGPNAFAAVETATGETRWLRGDVLVQPPVYECPAEESGLCRKSLRGELKGKPTFSGLQPALAYEDSIVFLLSEEGPVRVNAQNGEVVWRSELSGSPRRGVSGNAPMRIEGDLLLVSQGTKVTAIDLRTGSIRWPRPKEAKKRKGNVQWGGWKRSGGALSGGAPKEDGPVSVVDTSAASALVYGYSRKGDVIKDKYFDLLDISTGSTKWGQRFTDIKDWGRLDGVMVGDTIYFVNGNKRKLTLYEVSASGVVREVGTLEIRGSLDMVEYYDGNLLITSEEEMIMVRPKDASVVYKADFPAPEVRMAEVLAAGLVTTLASAGAGKANEAVYKKQMKKGDVRSAAVTAQNQSAIDDNLDKRLASQDTEVLSAIARLEDYVYFYLSKNAGGGARALVEVSKKDGTVTRKVPLEGVPREINYEIDPPNNRVIIQHKGGVVAMELPPLAGSGPATPSVQSGGTEPAAAVAAPGEATE